MNWCLLSKHQFIEISLLSSFMWTQCTWVMMITGLLLTSGFHIYTWTFLTGYNSTSFCNQGADTVVGLVRGRFTWALWGFRMSIFSWICHCLQSSGWIMDERFSSMLHNSYVNLHGKTVQQIEVISRIHRRCCVGWCIHWCYSADY